MICISMLRPTSFPTGESSYSSWLLFLLFVAGHYDATRVLHYRLSIGVLGINMAFLCLYLIHFTVSVSPFQPLHWVLSFLGSQSRPQRECFWHLVRLSPKVKLLLLSVHLFFSCKLSAPFHFLCSMKSEFKLPRDRAQCVLCIPHAL